MKNREQFGRARIHMVRFMLSRLVGLLLTDARATVQAQEVSASIDIEPPDSRTYFYFQPIVLLLYYWKAGNQLLDNVLPQTATSFEWQHADASAETARAVDWNETILHWATTGSLQPAAKLRTYNAEQARCLSSILRAYCQNSRKLYEFFEKYFEQLPAAVEQMALDNEHTCRRIDLLLASNGWNDGDACFLQAEEARFSALMHRGNSSVRPNLADADLARNQPGCLPLLEWYDKLSKPSILIGDGGDFRLRSKGAPHRIYELWCFLEYVEALRRCAPEPAHLHQKALLTSSRTQELFGSDDSAFRAYYDQTSGTLDICGQSGNHRPSLEPALDRLRVDWYVLWGKGNSAVFDTKFTSAWRTESALTTLGYMLNYGAATGIVCYAGGILPDIVGGERITDHLRKVPCPRYEGHALWILSLVPTLSDQYRNEKALDALVRYAFTSKAVPKPIQ